MTNRPIDIEIEIPLSKLIRIGRDRLHLSQSELAKAAGVSRNYISLIERGSVDNVTLKVLRRIFVKLGLTMKIVWGDE